MTRSEFPRVLVVTSNNFNLVAGGGITLTNLFQGWPADRIANLHEDPTPEDHSVCQKFYRLSEEEIQWAWPFSLFKAWYEGPPSMSDGNRVAGEGTETPIQVLEGAKLLQMARRVFGDGVPRNARISNPLQHWLDAFQPQVLYGFLGSMAQIRLVGELKRRYRLPVAIHMMDDWPAVIYRRGLFGPLLRRVVQREFEAVLREAHLCLAICEEMCEEYQERYGRQFLPFHNAIDIDQWIPHAERDWTAGSPFIVRYVGSIVPDAQREALKDVCKAVANLRASKRSIEMWVHAPKTQSSYLKDCGFSVDGVRLVDPPPPETVPRLLSEADLLVLPFNFDSRSARYIRLSMPTKVPAYMASGTPILVYGPAGIATARYAEREGWGHVLSTGPAPLQRTLLWLMDDQVAREQLGRRAQRLACEHHDAAKVRPAFQMALARAASARRVDERLKIARR
jgi:glycosyltransferase involved in cell wall biosynthesis